MAVDPWMGVQQEWVNANMGCHCCHYVCPAVTVVTYITATAAITDIAVNTDVTGVTAINYTTALASIT